MTVTNPLAYHTTELITTLKCLLIAQAPGTVFTTLHFLRKIVMGPLRQSVILHQARKTYQGQTLQLIGTIRKLRENEVF